jgi:hypothetical protein
MISGGADRVEALPERFTPSVAGLLARGYFPQHGQDFGGSRSGLLTCAPDADKTSNMMGEISARSRSRLRATLWCTTLAAVGMLGCGESKDPAVLFEPVAAPDESATEPPVTVSPVVDIPPNTGETTGVGPLNPPPDTGEDEPCRPPPGISGRPTNLQQAMALMNSLPKPTTLACFIEALDRPLTLYMTENSGSLQPAQGPRSPRTFILYEHLEMSIVLDGEASYTLELGYRPQPQNQVPERSIKSEILFPITKDVLPEGFFDRIQRDFGGSRTTKCSDCHNGEEFSPSEEFPNGVFESDVLDPYTPLEVKLPTLQAEVEICDPAVEEHRCGLLDALFGHGEVLQGKLGTAP